MTDQEKRSLKSYLTNCLGPAYTHYSSEMVRWSECKAVAKGHDLELSKSMCQYSLGKVQAIAHAIADFKELFAEELATVED